MLRYDALTDTVIQRNEIFEMSKRDKINLLVALMNNLGVANEIATSNFAEQFNNFWAEQFD